MLGGLGFLCTGLTQPGTFWEGLGASWFWFVGALLALGMIVGLLLRAPRSFARTIVIILFALAFVASIFMGTMFFRIGADCGGVPSVAQGADA